MSDDSKTIDGFVGKKIKERRARLRISQSELGAMLGVSAQQIQRYESGENGVALGKLPQLAAALNVQTNYFIQDLPDSNQLGLAHSDVVRRGLGRSMRLLIIDDDTNDVLLFQSALAKKDNQATLRHVSRADDVLEYLNTSMPGEYPDIIILDINLPRISGIEVLQMLKQSVHSKIPVIMLTNSARAKDVVQCYEHHANGFIQKSAQFSQFCKDVGMIMDYWSNMTILPSMA